jgi:hypothetical protein
MDHESTNQRQELARWYVLLLEDDQRESAAGALGVEAPARLEVAVDELRVLARRAEDATRVRGAGEDGLLGRGSLHLI